MQDLEISRYIRLMDSGIMSLDGLISHEYALEDINQVFNMGNSIEEESIIINMTTTIQGTPFGVVSRFLLTPLIN